MNFPNVDPIPLPAPVWLMKTLGLLTLALHFGALQLLVGSLINALFLQSKGLRTKDSAAMTAANVLARRLPIIMTYVINFGVPPLLFAQVLYGRALYTSSVLMAVSWGSVVLLLMAQYWFLYQMSAKMSQGKSGILFGLISLAITFAIGKIYAMNMTLMLRPEVWVDMYAAKPNGTGMPTGDPTTLPRYLFVMVGGLVGGGIWSALHGSMSHVPEQAAALLRKSGGLMTAIGAVLLLPLGYMVMSTQTPELREALAAQPLFNLSGYLVIGTTLLVALIGAAQAMGKMQKLLIIQVNALLAFLGIAGMVLVRDGIRDITLKSKGFDVWDRTVVTNWSVVGLFLLLFVVALVILGWLLSIMKRAQAPQEEPA